MIWQSKTKIKIRLTMVGFKTSKLFSNFMLLYFFYVCHVSSKITLEKISTLYIPASYRNGEGEYKFDGGAVEQGSYDWENKILYSVGHNNIHIIEIANASSPEILYHQTFGDYDVTDVEFCGGYVFVALDNLADKENGEVRIFHHFNKKDKSLVQIHKIIVGSLPDMVKPTSDCLTILVAVEAEAYALNGSIVDPEGGIGVIKFETDDLTKNYNYTFLDFRKYNNHWKDLVNRGARFIYRQNGNTFAQDLEPEYIAYNDDHSKAYIGLQENNAVAIVDMVKTEIIDIYPLGYKHWGDIGLDVSDKDNGINIRKWPVYGMYQPDSIHTINFDGNTYLITCNEGDSKDYSVLVPGGFNEEARVNKLTIKNASPITRFALKNNMTIQTLLQNNHLGRLKVTTENGRAPNAYEYEALYTFGARSFSIRSGTTMELYYDSGNDIEEKHAEYLSYLFNSNPDDNYTLAETFDARSDDKGPETEGLAVAHVGKMVVLFVGNERPGTVSIYSITDDLYNPNFESIYSGIADKNGTWDDLFNRRQLSEVDPEDIRYVPAEQSPTGDHMLIISGSVSGTVSLFSIKGLPSTVAADDDSYISNSSKGHSPWYTNIITLLLLVFYLIRHPCI